MKKLMQIDENKLIEIIKSMLVEQADEELAAQYGRDVNLNMLPTQGVPAVAQPTAQPAVAQPTAQPQQKTRACASYTEKTKGPYKLCDSGPAIKTLQTQLGFTGKAIDGKLGVLTMKAAKKQNLTETNGTILDTKINKPISNAPAPNTKQSNLGIVVNLRNVEPNTSFEKAFVVKSKVDGREIIKITDYRGVVYYSTSCKAMETSRFWNLGTKKYDDFSKFENLIIKLKYNFCSKKSTNVNVTNIIKTTPEISLEERRRFRLGSSYRAVIVNNSISILTEKNETIFYTDCNNLKNNTFFRHYGQTNIYKQPIVLAQLAKAVLPLCNK